MPLICTNMSKNAEPRAEQQARLIAMPRRESSSAIAKAPSRERSSAPSDFSIAKLRRNTYVGKIVESEWTPRNKKWTPGNKKWTPKRQKWSRNLKKWSRDHKKVDTKRVQKWTPKKEAYPSFEKYTSLYIYRKKPYANLLIYVLKAVTSSRWRF